VYCSNCGNAVNEKLKYCNTCGERLAEDKDDKNSPPGKMLDSMLTALFLVVMFGLGTLVGLVAVLLGNGVPKEAVTIIAVAYLAAVFGICFMLLGQVKKLVDFKLSGFVQESDQASRPQLLKPKTTAQLDEYRQPAASVTEHTTRTLEKVPVSRDPSQT